MIKRFALSALLLPFIFTATAQQAKTSFLYRLVEQTPGTTYTAQVFSLFTKASTLPSAKINATLAEKLLLDLNKNAIDKLFTNRPTLVRLIIPAANGAGYQLNLIQQDINTSGEFSFGTIEGNAIRKKISGGQGLNYRGYINGDFNSMAAFSVFSNGELMAVFSGRDGNFNIGKTADHQDKYILYNSKDMLATLGFECTTSEIPVTPKRSFTAPRFSIPSTDIIPPVLCKKVRVYWEADYKLFSNNFGSDLTATQNYIAGIFNEVAAMYQNEGIIIELAGNYIWITPDPYNTSTSTNGLDTFQARWNALGDSFDGDLAMIIDGSPTNNGGVAYLVVPDLCVRDYAYGYVDVYGTYNTVPVYSWDVEVLTHEMGHILGSHHTHWCGWNTGFAGACGAIDDCYTLETGSGCSTCPPSTTTFPAPPGFQGTVMSYCHLRSGIGISLANGFGPLPQAAIRASVNGTTCTLSGNKWTGTVSTAWEDPANWGCGSIPDASTDVTISAGLPNYPVVNSAAICHRIIQVPGTSVLVKTGFSLMVTGPPN